MTSFSNQKKNGNLGGGKRKPATIQLSVCAMNVDSHRALITFASNVH
ncbi:hypothetical protein ABH944_008713 [Caballeronia udeis]|uniref:Uncharacterized protein n=1 Tax=Caballeronia udeis TaxID=1232866 RepID=A0ABW8MY66_9BURK